MHLQQTKAGSRETGGPQYYFHGVPAPVKEYLRRRGACPVVLHTPYGIASSSFMAVDKDHKLDSRGRIVSGRVGHDRIQRAGGNQSIGESIRYWYGLPAGPDFETIEVEATIHHAGHFILVPTAVLMRGARRPRILEKLGAPLSFHRHHQSRLWKRQIAAKRASSSSELAWIAFQIKRVVADHRGNECGRSHEADLLRTAGALSMLGLQLSPYLVKGYDCPRSRFRFAGLPEYTCPVEIKKRSSRFSYQMTRYTELPRAVVLCLEHDYVNPPEHIDFLELSALADYLSN